MNEWVVVAAAVALLAAGVAVWIALRVSAQFSALRAEVKRDQEFWIKEIGFLETRGNGMKEQIARLHKEQQASQSALEVHAKAGFRDGHRG